VLKCGNLEHVWQILMQLYAICNAYRPNICFWGGRTFVVSIATGRGNNVALAFAGRWSVSRMQQLAAAYSA